jgi:mono/diheme cytochrome c family protein
MHGNALTGWLLLLIALVAAVVIAVGLYRWDVSTRAAEASLRPQPVAPLAATPPPAPVAAAAASPLALAAPAPGGDVAAGQAVFQRSCNPCHPGANAGIGPALHGAAFDQRYPDNAAIAAVVRNGRGGMPPFATIALSDADLTNLIAYLRSLPAPSIAAAAATNPPVDGAATNQPAAALPATGAAATTVTARNPPAPASPTPLSQQVLSSITPGLSSYMLETAKRMGRSWFAAQAGNWDEAAFEVREARGVLQQGAARSSPSRQQALVAFDDGFMTPLATAAQSGDAAQYDQAYRAAIGGCNACHASQTYGVTNQPFSFIRVQVPTNSIWDVYAYAK